MAAPAPPPGALKVPPAARARSDPLALTHCAVRRAAYRGTALKRAKRRKGAACERLPHCKMEDSFDCDCGELEPPDH
ncbi:hypothetical protein GN956_G22624 [Arapaima gigas]